jgi:hypothetical protein
MTVNPVTGAKYQDDIVQANGKKTAYLAAQAALDAAIAAMQHLVDARDAAAAELNAAADVLVADGQSYHTV